MKKIFGKLLRILKKLTIVSIVLFVASFVVYFFNLDMKAAALLEKPLTWHYDNNIKRDKRV